MLIKYNSVTTIRIIPILIIKSDVDLGCASGVHDVVSILIFALCRNPLAVHVIVWIFHNSVTQLRYEIYVTELWVCNGAVMLFSYSLWWCLYV